MFYQVQGEWKEGKLDISATRVVMRKQEYLGDHYYNQHRRNHRTLFYMVLSALMLSHRVAAASAALGLSLSKRVKTTSAAFTTVSGKRVSSENKSYHPQLLPLCNRGYSLSPPQVLHHRQQPLRLFSQSSNEIKSSSSSTAESVFPSFNPAAYTLPPFPSVITSSDLKKHQRIVTFGDVHGDITALQQFLVTAGVLDPTSTASRPRWVGGDTICVQCGDILDRGDDELACLRLLTDLSRQAVSQNGALVMLYGNHEALNAVGLFHYANEKGNQEFEDYLGESINQDWNSDRWRVQYAGNQPARWAAFEPGGFLANSLLTNMKVAVVLGKTVFVHAGLTKQHIEQYEYSIDTMNQRATDWIQTKQHDHNNNEGVYNSVAEVMKNAQARATVQSETMPACLGGGIGSSSPVWMRDYSQPHDVSPSNPKAQSMINDALSAITNSIYDEQPTLPQQQVQRMIMGHTPQTKINAALQGKAWRVDVGASKGVMSGSPEVLEIIHGGVDEDDELYILTTNGERISAKDRHIVDIDF